MIVTGVRRSDDFEVHSRTPFGAAILLHGMLLGWNPTVLVGGSTLTPPPMMQVEYADKLPPIAKPAPVVKRVVKKPVVKKAHKAGISLARHRIHVTAHPARVASKPPAKTRRAPVQMPKYVPHAVEDEIVTAAPRTKLATTVALHPATAPPQLGPTLKGRSRGVRLSDVHFELTDKGSLPVGGPGAVVNIPVGEEAGEIAVVTSAPILHEAAKGPQRITGAYDKPGAGNGLGELSGKNRVGYHGAVQVGEPSDQEIALAAGSTGRRGISGQGFELGGPVGDRKILHRHLPEYPLWAEEKGISALVKIYFMVNPDGTIRRHIRVLRSSGYAELDDLAKTALLTWRFSPTSERSEEEAWGVIVFKFTLT
jgi:TonB family protein